MVTLALWKVSPSMIRFIGMSGQSLQQMMVEHWDRSRVGSGVAISMVKGNGGADGVGEAEDSVTRNINPTRTPMSALWTRLSTSYFSFIIIIYESFI
jgi:hypothetical protein